MTTRITTTRRASAVLPALLLAVACGSDGATEPEPGPPDNAAPEITEVPDQTVVRNTAMPRSVEVALEISDPDDDAFTVTVASDDAGVIPGTTFACGSASCALTFTPSPEATAVVALEVTVEDGRGGQAATGFDVHVVPRLVTNTDDAGQGSLRAAVAAAEPGDVIGFDTNGAFGGTQTIHLLEEIVLAKDATIEGTGVDRLTVSGNGSVRVFRVTEAADVTIRDLTIAEGRAEIEEIAVPTQDSVVATFVAWGGGVYMDTGTRVTLRNCAVRSNSAVSGESPAGGGIANLEGTLDIENCHIHDNLGVSLGGGIFNAGFLTSAAPAVTFLSTSTVSDNATTSTTFGHGGGVYSGTGSLIIEASRIVRNAATGGGGGVYGGFDGSVVIRNGSEVSENSADRGGGIVNDQAVMTISGSTVEANSSASDGGGILNGQLAVLTLEAGTAVVDNVATERGGGIYNDDNNASVVLEAGTSVTGNTAGAPPPSGGGIFNEGTLENGGDVSGNSPDDVAP